MRVGLAALFALAGSGCLSENGGTAVGNPTSMEPTLARSPDVTFTNAFLPATLSAADCGDQWADLDASQLDLIALDPIETTTGLCSLVVTPSGPLQIDGYTETVNFTGSVEIPELLLVADAPVTAPATVLEFASPGWLDADKLGKGNVAIRPDDVTSAAMARILTTETALWADPDRDGLISAQERMAGPLAVASGDVEEIVIEDEEDEEDEGDEEDDAEERDPSDDIDHEKGD